MATSPDCVDLSDAVDYSDQGIPYVLTSAGAGPNEDNDCAIRAFAVATGFSYDLIYDLVRVCMGRKPNESVRGDIRHLPFRLRLVSKRRLKLYKVMDHFPRGRYVIDVGPIKGSHMQALVDGKIYDRDFEPPDGLVSCVWKITGVKKRDYLGNKI
jgi:hypothetical protein